MMTESGHSDPEALFLSENGGIPNSDLPVLIYRIAAHHDDLEKVFHQSFAAHGWGGTWVGGVFDYHHFHSNAHEVLGVVTGTGTLLLGGEDGAVVHLGTGDVVILPAGTGHKCISANRNFRVLGAYPEGQEDYDIQTDSADCPDFRARLGAVRLPERDPLYGQDGPLVRLWGRMDTEKERIAPDDWPETIQAAMQSGTATFEPKGSAG